MKNMLAAALLILNSFILFSEPLRPDISGDTAGKFTGPVKTEYGPIRGLILEGKKSILVFKGVPFAAPPVGKLRWKPPVPPEHWDEVRDCVEFGPGCPQPKHMVFDIMPEKTKFSEDCLYLNIWTPASPSSKEKFPVMVWIHGGGYTTGSGSQKVYDGRRLAEKGVVIVTINYRLGPFGFFAHPALSRESEKGVSGNYGLLDQIAALQWVKNNIAGFGGNPDCVTIFGESAGAGSVTALMASPLAKGLFHRAIAESGFAGGLTGLKSTPGARPSMEQIGENIVRKLKLEEEADLLDKMRALKPEEIIGASDAVTGLFGKGNKFRPCVDGYVLPDYPWVLFGKGLQTDVPFITGTTADEGSIFIGNFNIRRIASYRLLMKAIFKDDAGMIFSLYPVSDRSQIKPVLCAMVSDMAFIAPARFAVRSQEKLKSKSYLYHFTRVPEGAEKFGLGAFHAIELQYVFKNMDGSRMNYAATDHRLSEIISSYWVNFAATGNPNGKDLPEWPAYSADKDEHLEFGDTVKTASALHRKACDFFEKMSSDKMGFGMEAELSRQSGSEDEDLVLPGMENDK